jgi:hypothetical protein
MGVSVLFNFTYRVKFFRAAPRSVGFITIIRSHQLPPEFSSFSMDAVPFVHGTNSKFIVWPDCSSKSLLHPISEFAGGSQAAQHNVRSVAWPSAIAAVMPVARIAPAAAVIIDWFSFDLSSQEECCKLNRRFYRNQ